MPERNIQRTLIFVFTLTSIFLILLVFSTSLVYAGGGSIEMENTYPENNRTYCTVDYFLYQITDKNTNTTIAVSIDNGPLISMNYEGTKNETFTGNTVTCQWHTWHLAIPAITSQGKHTFQFFSHYHVWQDQDGYWAEFNSRSEVKYFSIDDLRATSSETPQKPIADSYVSVILSSSLIALLVNTAFMDKRTTRRKLLQ
jgi:hypothetical protein